MRMRTKARVLGFRVIARFPTPCEGEKFKSQNRLAHHVATKTAPQKVMAVQQKNAIAKLANHGTPIQVMG